MSKTAQLLLMPCTLLILAQLFCFFHFSLGDIGTAATYSPPYTPTACYGNDASQFPSSNLFAAAGEGIWDNGAACGRQYKVRCISATVPRTCIPNKTIQIRIVDRAQTSVSKPTRGGTTMVLTTTAFGTIANGSSASINVEFQEVLNKGQYVSHRSLRNGINHRHLASVTKSPSNKPWVYAVVVVIGGVGVLLVIGSIGFRLFIR